MTHEENIDRIARAVLEDCKTDIVGLWVVLGEVREACPSITNLEARKVSLAVVERALALGIELGSFAPHGDFHLWKLAPAAALRRIEEIWINPDQQLTLDHNIWLSGRDLEYRTAR